MPLPTREAERAEFEAVLNSRCPSDVRRAVVALTRLASGSSILDDPTKDPWVSAGEQMSPQVYELLVKTMRYFARQD